MLQRRLKYSEFAGIHKNSGVVILILEDKNLLLTFLNLYCDFDLNSESYNVM